MDRYQKVEKPRPESAINENEIRITGQGLVRNYVNYAASLLQEKHMSEIVLKAMGQAISKTVAIAEIIKKKIPGVYQETATSSVSITDMWEPIEEGLVPVEMTRHVSMISITLSTSYLNKDSPGYQAPLHIEQPKRQQRYQQRQHLQQQQQLQPKQSHDLLNEDSYAQGRGRGRGRDRGRGRGRWWGRGYGGYGGGYGVYDTSEGAYGGYGGYGNNRGGYGGYGYNKGGYDYDQGNGGWNPNWGRGGGRGMGGQNYRGPAYAGGRVGGVGRARGRGYGNGRGRIGGRGSIGGRGRGNQY